MIKVTITGSLDLAQFWPDGESDADTTKLVVDVSPGAIRYQLPGESAKPTSAYNGAFVKGFGQRNLVIDKGKMTVRLQGIDAPELHYQPQSMAKTKYKGKPLGSLAGSGLVKKYRQHQGETATVRLGKYLQTLGTSPLHCEFVTQLNDDQGPGDAIDKYGRFVGNIQVSSVDVNLEILRRGWAIVALYNSMQNAEIADCISAGKVGLTATDGVLKYLTSTIGQFETSLLYRKNGSIESEGTLKFIHPKIYRRQCTWWAYRKLGTFKSGLDTFLGLSKDDVFFETKDFLDNGRVAAIQIPLEKMVKDGKKVVYSPDQVVFKDAPSTLYRDDGSPVTTW